MKIDWFKIIADICPKCGATSHDTNNILNCTTNPTDLIVEDLRTRPILTVALLELETKYTLQQLLTSGIAAIKTTFIF